MDWKYFIISIYITFIYNRNIVLYYIILYYIILYYIILRTLYILDIYWKANKLLFTQINNNRIVSPNCNHCQNPRSNICF